MCLDRGIMVNTYISDNGVFKGNNFVQNIREHNQRIWYCGVKVHNHNGVSEQLICIVFEMAHYTMLQSYLRC